MENKFSMQVQAKLENEKFIRSAVANFFLPLNPTVAEVNDIKTAVSEAITNCIVHGYSNRGGIIDIECSYKETLAYVTIKDFGTGIDDIPKAREPFFTTKKEQERSGMGFTLMDTFMTSVEVYNNKEGGLTVSMTKSILG